MRARQAAAACVAVGLAGFVATYAFFVRTAAGQRLDDRLHLDGRGFFAHRLLNAYDHHVIVGEITVLAVIFVSTVARGQVRRGVLCVGMPVLMVVLADTGKVWLPRPDIVPDWTNAVANTFPSGHVGFAAATVAAVLLAVPVAWRPAVLAVGAPAVSLVLVATVQAHWHRASDGIGSLFLVLALSGAVVLLSPAPAPVTPTPQRPQRRELARV